jgi:dTDP-4-dehydrorhamnose reductase
MQCILVTGGNGLLAHALKEVAPPYFQLFFPGHAEFDHFNRS